MIYSRNKLESSVDQFTDYDGHYDDLSQWLKETEAKMRNQASLMPDMDSKQEQQRLFKVSTATESLTPVVLRT